MEVNKNSKAVAASNRLVDPIDSAHTVLYVAHQIAYTGPLKLHLGGVGTSTASGMPY